MTNEQFLQEFGRFANAPNGVKKLRELILQLAVQGKLVEQDPNDEPAAVLLERIREEKERLVKEKKIRKGKALSPVSGEPYKAPFGWTWSRFGDVTICRDGDRVPLSKEVRSNRTGKYDYYGASGVIDCIDDFIFDKPLLLIGEDGANLVNRSTPIAFIAEGEYWVNNHAHVIDGISQGHLEYICLFINATDLIPYITGTAQPKMNQAKMNSILVALPPSNEQFRIVARVNELMALCDQLEAKQKHQKETHQQLIRAAHHALTEANNPAETQTAWQRIRNNFSHLYTTIESIQALRQTILQLAVQGKLVPQDPSEEPASALLQSIQIEKEQLLKSKSIKGQNYTPLSLEEFALYAIPENWKWTYFGELILQSESGWSPKAESVPAIDKQWGVLKVSAISWGEYRASENKALIEGTEPRSQHEVHSGDFLISRANTAELVARSVVVEATPPNLMMSDKIIRLKFGKNVDLQYLNLFNNSSFSRSYYSKVAGGTSSSMKNVSRQKIGALPVALPPIGEQALIVEKAAMLMMLCDQLESNINEQSVKSTNYVDATIDGY